MKRIAIVAVLAALGAGCATYTPVPFVQRNYNVGARIEASIGNVLITRTAGTNVVVTRKMGARNEQVFEQTTYAAGRFERQLIYTGVAGGTLKLSYREYNNDLARPAFTQDLQYDLNQSDVIAYRGIRLKVLSATNERIAVQVLATDDPEDASLAAPTPKPVTKPVAGAGPKACEVAADCTDGGICFDGFCRR